MINGEQLQKQTYIVKLEIHFIFLSTFYHNEPRYTEIESLFFQKEIQSEKRFFSDENIQIYPTFTTHIKALTHLGFSSNDGIELFCYTTISKDSLTGIEAKKEEIIKNCINDGWITVSSK